MGRDHVRQAGEVLLRAWGRAARQREDRSQRLPAPGVPDHLRHRGRAALGGRPRHNLHESSDSCGRRLESRVEEAGHRKEEKEAAATTAASPSRRGCSTWKTTTATTPTTTKTTNTDKFACSSRV